MSSSDTPPPSGEVPSASAVPSAPASGSSPTKEERAQPRRGEPSSSRRQKAFLRGGPAVNGGKRPRTERIVTAFERIAFAYATVICLLVAVGGLYVGLHVLTGCSCEKRNGEMQGAVQVSPDGRLALTYRDGLLERNFAKDKINELKQHLDERRLQALPVILAQRRQVLIPAVEFARSSLADRPAPGVLSLDPHRVQDNDLLLPVLPEMRIWLENQLPRLAPEKRAWLSQIVQALCDQELREERLRQDFKVEVDRLEAALSFCWLWVDGCGWVGEVIFWSLFGVLANTIIALITKSRENRYSADEFVLVFPKIVLAPLLALVVVAIWATGFSDAQVGFLNLPMFLVMAFSLGFATEQLYTLLRDLAQGLVQRLARFADFKLEAAARNEPYRFVHPPASPATVPPPTNLVQLRQTLTTVAQAEMERGIVAQSAQN